MQLVDFVISETVGRILCLFWSSESTIQLRECAAEACGWIQGIADEDGTDGFGKLYKRLSTDPEKNVREAAKRSREDCIKRTWAEEYLRIIRRVSGHSNQEILDAWPYGEALTRIGDDSCIHRLRVHLSGSSYPPHVRYWIRQIIKELEKNWRKTTQEWPDPWLPWEGAIERGKGRLAIYENNMVEITYSIWLQPTPTPSGKHDWGGAIWATQAMELGHATIELEGGGQGKIDIQYISGGIATFVGNGPYPK